MHGGESEADPNLTPLLDVVLQLIMFFMITVNFVNTDHLNKDIRLPVAQGLVPKDKDEDKEDKKEKVDARIFVNLDRESEIIGVAELPRKDPQGRSFQTRGSIEAWLRNEMTQYERQAKLENRKPKVTLVLRADKAARYHKVFDILEAGRMAGIERYDLHVMSQAEPNK